MKSESRFVNIRPLVVISLSFVSGIFLISYAVMGTSLPFFLGLAALILSAAVLIFRRSTGRRAAFLLSAVCLFCYLAGGANLFLRAKRYEGAALPSAYYTVTGRVGEVVSYAGGSVRLTLDSLSFTGYLTRESSYKMHLYTQGSYETGDILRFTAAVESYSLRYEGRVRMDYMMDGVRFRCEAEENGISALGSRKTAFEKARAFLEDTLRSGMEEDEAAISLALLTGYDAFMDEEVLTQFRRAGVAHIFAVSGLHIGFLAGALYFLFKKIPVDGYVKLAVVLPVLALYSGVCGFTPSSLRAVAMAGVLLFLNRSGERYDGLSSLLFSALIVLGISPFQLFDVGFQLSYTVVLGIILLSGRIARLLSFFGKRISGSLGVILSAQIAAFPVSLYYFGEVSLAAIFFNLLLIPVVSVLFVALLLLTVLGGLFQIPAAALFLPKWGVFAIKQCILFFDLDYFIAGGFALGFGGIVWYFAMTLTAGMDRLKKRSVAVLCCALAAVFGVSVAFANLDPARGCAAVIGDASLSAAILPGDEAPVLVVARFRRGFSLSRLRRAFLRLEAESCSLVVLGEEADVHYLVSRLNAVILVRSADYYGEERPYGEYVGTVKFHSRRAEPFSVDGLALSFCMEGEGLLADGALIVGGPGRIEPPATPPAAVIADSLADRWQAVYPEASVLAFRADSGYPNGETEGNLYLFWSGAR